MIQKMSDQAQQLYKEAIEAYLTDDDVRSAAIGDMDSFLDDLQRQFIAQIFESHSAEKIDLQVAVQLAVVARFYERIGDHAVNIGDRMRFIVTGWVAEHEAAPARYAERQAASRSRVNGCDGDDDRPRRPGQCRCRRRHRLVGRSPPIRRSLPGASQDVVEPTPVAAAPVPPPVPAPEPATAVIRLRFTSARGGLDVGLGRRQAEPRRRRDGSRRRGQVPQPGRRRR